MIIMLKSSILSYPDRGPYGDSKFRGNTTGHLIKDLINEFKLQGVEINKVLDPMEGSGTTGDVCKELGIEYVGLDLSKGFDLVNDTIPDEETYNFIFLHPPYYKMIKYSDDPRDLSNKTYKIFLRDLATCIIKCYNALDIHGILAVQLGDYRKGGNYYFITSDVMPLIGRLRDRLKGILIKVQHNVRSNGYFYGSKFIPIKHEYILILQKK